MFTKPMDEITFEDVETFCQEWAEGVRVEYKREIKVNTHIPKIVSSFANTHGGIFLIGVEANQTNNQVTSIPGIPQQNGIEEQIQQSALTGIYPGVIPEIKVVDVPHSKNVVVVVRVDESVQAPHAIQNSTRVYIRTGSITEPYELSDMDRISHMLKRRENSQVVARQILDRIENRVKNFEPIFKRIGNSQHLSSNFPTLTVIARPIFPYRPVISTSDIYELQSKQPSSPRRVAGGVAYLDEGRYLELNEYGIVYQKTIMLIDPDEQGIEYGRFIRDMSLVLEDAKDFYEKCGYLGNIEVIAKLQEVLNKKLYDSGSRMDQWKITENTRGGPVCHDSYVFASKQSMARDLENAEKQRDIVEELTCQLLWAFDIPIDQPQIRKQVKDRIERNI